MNRKLAVGIAASAGALLAVTACSSSSSSSSSAPASSAAATSASASASTGGAASIVGSSSFNDAQLQALTKTIQGKLSGKSLSGVKIAMITNGNSAYWNEAKAGWNDAMKWLGGKGASGVFQEPTASTASAQVSLLETLTSQGYTGWGVSAVEAQSLTTPIS
jgi:ribose transport system substrate-binding protein